MLGRMTRPRSHSAAPQARVPWDDWQTSIRALLERGDVAATLLTIEQALNAGQPAAELLALLEQVPEAARDELPAVRLRLRLLTNTDGAAQVRAAAQATGPRAPFFHAYLAWAFARQENYPQALAHAGAALESPPDLSAREQALAWRMRGLALNRLDPASDWDTPFQEALRLTEGWGRAMVLIDLGGLQSRQGREEDAMLSFSRALGLMPGQPYYQAWTLNNMGLICLRAGRLEEAESYFGRVARLRSGFRGRALAGQATVRRALGEWARATALYEQAIRAAQLGNDQDDLRHARRGLGHTQRLSGQVMQALDTLQQAAQTTDADLASGRSWVNVDLAAALVTRDLLDPAAVRAHLERAETPDREDRERAVIVRAELARREGRPGEARDALLSLGRTSLWAREEAHAFGALFALLPPAQRPDPLPRPPQTHVHLRLLGVPEVSVNGRRVRLGGLEVALLAALVLDGDLTTEALMGVVDDHVPRTRRLAGQRVSRVVSNVRAGLGWPGSVVQEGGTYLLDRAAHWTTDLGPQTGPVELFMRGVHLPWVTEREQELRQQD